MGIQHIVCVLYAVVVMLLVAMPVRLAKWNTTPRTVEGANEGAEGTKEGGTPHERVQAILQQTFDEFIPALCGSIDYTNQAAAGRRGVVKQTDINAFLYADRWRTTSQPIARWIPLEWNDSALKNGRVMHASLAFGRDLGFVCPDMLVACSVVFLSDEPGACSTVVDAIRARKLGGCNLFVVGTYAEAEPQMVRYVKFDNFADAVITASTWIRSKRFRLIGHPADRPITAGDVRAALEKCCRSAADSYAALRDHIHDTDKHMQQAGVDKFVWRLVMAMEACALIRRAYPVLSKVCGNWFCSRQMDILQRGMEALLS